MSTPTPATILNVHQVHHIRGGADRAFFGLTDLLTARGHRVIPFTAAHPANAPTPWSHHFPPAADFDRAALGDLARFLYNPAAGRALRRLLVAARPDLAHLHITYGALTPAIVPALRAAGLPVVQSLHDYRRLCPVATFVSHGRPCEACAGRAPWPALPRRCNRRSLPRTALSAAELALSRRLGAADLPDHFIAPSAFLRDKMVHYGLPADRVTVLPHAIDAAAIPPAAGEGDYFLYFGRLAPVKGLWTLLAAAERLPVPLLIAGDGELRDDLTTAVVARGLAHVRLLPFQHDDALDRLIAGSIATVLPAEWPEPFGLAALESLARARPVVGTQVGGLPEVVRDGVDGYLVPPGDAAALAARLRALAANRATAVALGQAGRRRALADFHPDAFYERLLAVYRRAAEGRG